MLQAPFIELAYFVGRDRVDTALSTVLKRSAVVGLAPSRRIGSNVYAISNLIGLARDEEAETHGGRIILRTEGEIFCGSARTKKRKLLASGRKVYERFLSYVSVLDPFYGAILLEYSLEEPDELRSDPRSLAFRDFYVASRVLGSRDMQQLRALAGTDSFVQEMPNGIYVSTTEECNPEGRSVESVQAQETSVAIGNLLGSLRLLDKGRR